ncbi:MULTISPECIES: hypothetical protein [Enterococcus]|uniref:Uncharacterized protein n=1 Tax=Enterococcus faecium TaxID=1352 RepID=A0AAI8PYM2_ENTFC|nr:MULTISPECIES: hypothetical protein [Enterococcus]AII40518.1 hypothetical protein M395_08390 [Enterococcus faecium T110]AYM73040.1 hypothetical protein D9Z05_07115 [Enterococcus faecium]QPB63654.1 hypothetical protein GFB66_06950 [Enterococcus faecium]TKB01904.1 hypothetical protein E6L37_00770 [Enterococcus lactis]URL56790.1 hypothetical protein IPZ63_06735 [Enterococcus lactis]
MVKAWLSGLTAYSVVGQTDLFSAFAMYLSKYRFVLLGALFFVILLTVLLSKKMSASSSTKSKVPGNKGFQKQQQYKNYRK